MTTLEIQAKLDDLSRILGYSTNYPGIQRQVAAELRKIALAITSPKKAAELDLRSIFETKGKIAAIKAYRESLGGPSKIGLYDAKVHIEHLAETQGWRQPQY